MILIKAAKPRRIMEEGAKAGSAITGPGGRKAAALPHFDRAIRPKCPPLADPDGV